MTQTPFQNPKSVAQATLIVLGFIILCENLSRAATHLTFVLSCTPVHAPGILSTIVLAASRALPTLVCDNPSIFRHLVGALASSWPLLCCVFGGA